MNEVIKYRDLHIPGDAAISAQFANPEFCVFYDAGTLIVICAKPMGPFAVADCWLAAENLMLAACAMGLGTCCIGSAVPALNTVDAKAELGIPLDVTAVAPIIVGVPSGSIAGLRVQSRSARPRAGPPLDATRPSLRSSCGRF